jgi:mannan endo-1,4-beta-mannosidase
MLCIDPYTKICNQKYKDFSMNFNTKLFSFLKTLFIALFMIELTSCYLIRKKDLPRYQKQHSFTFDNLINQNSSSEAVQLYERLKANYGKYVFSGQTTKYYDELKQLINATPVIQDFDMQNYSPHNPWFQWQPFDDGTIDKAISWYRSTNKKGIVAFQWHWFSPIGGQEKTSTFYTNNTNFNLTKAITPGTDENLATLRDIDAIAVQLKRLQAERIPILWRPLHEAGGGWFWWGSKTNK